MVTQDLIEKTLNDLACLGNGTTHGNSIGNSIAGDLLAKIEAEGVAPPEGYVLVPIEDCSMCNNDGFYSTTEGYPINCFCRDKANSRYNQTKPCLSPHKSIRREITDKYRSVNNERI